MGMGGCVGLGWVAYVRCPLRLLFWRGGGDCRTKEDDLEGGVTCQYLYVYFFCFVKGEGTATAPSLQKHDNTIKRRLFFFIKPRDNCSFSIFSFYSFQPCVMANLTRFVGVPHLPPLRPPP